MGELEEILDGILAQIVTYKVTPEKEKGCRVEGTGTNPDYQIVRDGKGGSVLELVFPARISEGCGIFREDEPVEIHIRIAEMTDPAIRTWGDA